MPSNTYWLNTKVGGSPYTNDPIVSQSLPYQQYGSVFSIFNQYGSGAVLNLKKIKFNEIIGRTTTGIQNISLLRTTAQGAGTDVNTIKLDSDNATLPSQISLKKHCTVTTTGNVFRNISGFPMLGTARNPLIGSRSLHGASFLHSSNPQSIYTLHDSVGTGIQPLTLAEGEGIALTTSAAPDTIRFEIRIYFNIVSSGESYFISEVCSQDILGGCILGVFNGVGSGVSLYIARIEIAEIYTDDAGPMFTIETISGQKYGDVVQAIPMDTTNAALPSGVEFRTHAMIMQSGPDSIFGRAAQQGGDAILRRVSASPFGTSAGLANGMIGMLASKFHWGEDYGSCALDTGSDIVIREGQGIAIIQRLNASGYGEYDITCLLTATITPEGNSGTHSFAWIS